MDLADRIRIGFERFNRRDWEGVSRGLPADFEAVDHVPPDELRAHGPDALKQITDANGDTAFADLRMEVLEVSIVGQEGDRFQAAVRVRAAGSGGSSGAPVEAEIGQLWTFAGGVAIRMEQFRTWDEALAAARRE